MGAEILFVEIGNGKEIRREEEIGGECRRRRLRFGVGSFQCRERCGLESGDTKEQKTPDQREISRQQRSNHERPIAALKANAAIGN